MLKYKNSYVYNHQNNKHGWLSVYIFSSQIIPNKLQLYKIIQKAQNNNINKKITILHKLINRINQKKYFKYLQNKTKIAM